MVAVNEIYSKQQFIYYSKQQVIYRMLIERNTAMQYTYNVLFHTVAFCKYCTFSTGTSVIYIFGEKHFVCLMPIKHFVYVFVFV